ncbi:MAG TPA: protein translocase subunit SecD, partial [Syntrophothermus lipocalidus]|nr:protein translocase subunit SecD [Syntrophothermus lipocalidus]
MSNRTGLIKLIAMLIAVGIVAYVAYQPIIHNLNLGLDLRGGVHVVMEAKERPGQKITDDTLKKTVGVLRNRVDRLGVKEPVIQTQGDRRVIIELAGVKDPNEAIRVIGKTAELQFIDENGKVWVTGRNLKDAKAGIDQEGQPKVDLTFDKEGAELFRK